MAELEVVETFVIGPTETGRPVAMLVTADGESNAFDDMGQAF